MADLRGSPPLYTSMVQENPNDPTKHQLAQGWIQWFSQLILAMQGLWIPSGLLTFSKTNPTKSSLSTTPYSTFMLITFDSGTESQQIKLDAEYYGLIFIESNGILTTIRLNGSSFSIPTLGANTIITSTLKKVG